MKVEIQSFGNRIGDHLTEACAQRGLTFYNLSKSSGVPLTTLMHIVDGTTKNPGIYTIIRLYNAMELSVMELLDELNDDV